MPTSWAASTTHRLGCEWVAIVRSAGEQSQEGAPNFQGWPPARSQCQKPTCQCQMPVRSPRQYLELIILFLLLTLTAKKLKSQTARGDKPPKRSGARGPAETLFYKNNCDKTMRS